VTSHQVPLSGLKAGQLYYFQAVSKDALGRTASSPILSFTTATTSQSNTQTPAPAPAPAPSGGTHQLTVSSTTAAPGQSVTLSWTAPSTAGTRDWIGWYKVGSSNREYLWYEWTKGAVSGSFSFKIPAGTASGQYEFRYLPNNGFTSVASSGSVTVQGTN
jgi:hypothetical protein